MQLFLCFKLCLLFCVQKHFLRNSFFKNSILSDVSFIYDQRSCLFSRPGVSLGFSLLCGLTDFLRQCPPSEVAHTIYKIILKKNIVTILDRWGFFYTNCIEVIKLKLLGRTKEWRLASIPEHSSSIRKNI